MKSCSRCKCLTAAFYRDKRASDGLQSQCIPCVRAGQKASNDRRRDEVLARRRALRADAPGGRVEESRSYYRRNGEKIRLRVAAYQAANQQAIAQSRRAWRMRNPGLAKARDQRAYLRAKDVYKSRAAARRAQMSSSPGYTKDDVARLLRLQRGRCAVCRMRLQQFEVDHVVPLSLGGEHSNRNIQLTCRACNRRKHSKHPVDFMRTLGFLL